MASDKTVISSQQAAEPDLLDARHLACPLPLFWLQRVLGARAVGDRVRLWATAAATRNDLPDFCRDNGFRLVETTETADGPVFLVERQ